MKQLIMLVSTLFIFGCSSVLKQNDEFEVGCNQQNVEYTLFSGNGELSVLDRCEELGVNENLVRVLRLNVKSYEYIGMLECDIFYANDVSSVYVHSGASINMMLFYHKSKNEKPIFKCEEVLETALF